MGGMAGALYFTGRYNILGVVASIILGVILLIFWDEVYSNWYKKKYKKSVLVGFTVKATDDLGPEPGIRNKNIADEIVECSITHASPFGKIRLQDFPDYLKQELVKLRRALNDDDIENEGQVCHSFFKCLKKTDLYKLFSEDEIKMIVKSVPLVEVWPEEPLRRRPLRKENG